MALGVVNAVGSTIARETDAGVYLHVGPEIGVKASGGIRTPEDAQKMVEAGATRIGASASVKIVRGEAAAATQTY